MVDEVGKSGPLNNQKMGKMGVKLDTLKENEMLFNYFKSAGLDEKSFVYETDIAKLKAAFDKNKNGKLSVDEAKEMGFTGKDKDIKKAIKMLDTIAKTDLADAELYPEKLNENETNFKNKAGVLVANETNSEVEGKKVSTITEFYDGDVERPKMLYREDDKGVVITKFNENNQMSSVVDATGEIEININYTYDENGKLSSSQEKSAKGEVLTTFENNKPTVVKETFGEITKVTTNAYDGENLVKQTIESDPNGLKEGVAKEEIIYSAPDIAAQKTTTKTDGTVETKQFKDGKEVVPEPEKAKLEKPADLNVEHDGEGNTYVFVKEGETFKKTAKRVLGENATDEDIAKFRELNADKIKQFGKNKVEAFRVGDKIKVQGELEYNEATKDILSVKAKDEEAKYVAKVGKKSTPPKNENAVAPPKSGKTETPPKKGNETKPSTGPVLAKAKEAGFRGTNNPNIFYDDKTETHQIWNEKQGKFLDLNKLTGVDIWDVNKDDTLVTTSGMTGKLWFAENNQLWASDEHDAKGNDLSSIYFDENGKVTLSKYYEHDAKGNDIKSTYFDENGKVERSLVREHDAKGNDIKSTYFDKNGKVERSLVREYDAKGNETKWVELDENNKIVKSTTDEFDGNNKLSKRTELGKNGVFVKETYYYDFMADKIKHLKTPNNTSTYNEKGELTHSTLAKALYDQLDGASLYSNTKKIVDKIDKDNVADVIEYFKKLSPKEPLFTYINNEWTIEGTSTKYSKLMDHIYNSLIDYAKEQNIKGIELGYAKHYAEEQNTEFAHASIGDGYSYNGAGSYIFDKDANTILQKIIEKRKAQYKE